MIRSEWVKGRRCSGCGASGRTDELHGHLCASCLGLMMNTADRRAKLEDTANQRSAKILKINLLKNVTFKPLSAQFDLTAVLERSIAMAKAKKRIESEGRTL